MALAWPSFQPTTLPSVLRAWTMSPGFIIMICPVDKPVLSFPSTEIDVASMLSPKLPARAAETYTGNMKRSFFSIFQKILPTNCQLSDVHHDRYVQNADTCGSRSVQRVVRLCRTTILSSEVSWVNAGPGATHRHKSGRLQEQQ